MLFPFQSIARPSCLTYWWQRDKRQGHEVAPNCMISLNVMKVSQLVQNILQSKYVSRDIKTHTRTRGDGSDIRYVSLHVNKSQFHTCKNVSLCAQDVVKWMRMLRQTLKLCNMQCAWYCSLSFLCCNNIYRWYCIINCFTFMWDSRFSRVRPMMMMMIVFFLIFYALVFCRFLGKYQHFEWTYCVRLQDWSFSYEDKNNKFLRNVGICLRIYRAPKTKTSSSSSSSSSPSPSTSSSSFYIYIFVQLW
jgi:hypothetical protein